VAASPRTNLLSPAPFHDTPVPIADLATDDCLSSGTVCLVVEPRSERRAGGSYAQSRSSRCWTPMLIAFR